LEVTPPTEAEMVVVPTATAVATPMDEMVATELGVEVQVAMVVTLAIEPSWYVAVAVYCRWASLRHYAPSALACELRFVSEVRTATEVRQ